MIDDKYNIDIVKITKSHNLSIKIDEKGIVTLLLPNNVSKTCVNDFLFNKQEWILSHKIKIINKLDQFNDFVNLKSFYLFGKKYELIFQNIKKHIINKDSIILPEKNKIKSIYNFLKFVCNEVIVSRFEYISNALNLKYSSLKFYNAKSSWGQCNKNGDIKLNFKIVMLDKLEIDYIIVHELCHTIEFNHSKKFYEKVSVFLKNYKTIQKNLKNKNFILYLYR